MTTREGSGRLLPSVLSKEQRERSGNGRGFTFSKPAQCCTSSSKATPPHSLSTQHHHWGSSIKYLHLWVLGLIYTSTRNDCHILLWSVMGDFGVLWEGSFILGSQDAASWQVAASGHLACGVQGVLCSAFSFSAECMVLDHRIGREIPPEALCSRRRQRVSLFGAALILSQGLDNTIHVPYDWDISLLFFIFILFCYCFCFSRQGLSV